MGNTQYAREIADNADNGLIAPERIAGILLGPSFKTLSGFYIDLDVFENYSQCFLYISIYYLSISIRTIEV